MRGCGSVTQLRMLWGCGCCIAVAHVRLRVLHRGYASCEVAGIAASQLRMRGCGCCIAATHVRLRVLQRGCA
eukprot:629340-Pyramimonas_sp.AAC.1